MSARQDELCYAPVPFRAFRDRSILGIPLVLLGIIAAHDRFGRNGQGCYASHRRMAALVGCAREVVTRALLLLEEGGYIAVDVAQHDRRLRSYRVLYAPEDVTAFEGRSRPGLDRGHEPANRCANPRAIPRPTPHVPEIGDVEITDQPEIGDVEITDQPEIGDVEITDQPEIGDVEITDQKAENPRRSPETRAPADARDNPNIFREAGINPAEAGSAMRLWPQPLGWCGTGPPVRMMTEAERRQSWHAKMQAMGVSREVRERYWEGRVYA